MDMVQPDGLDLRAAIASRAEGSITWKFKLAQDGQYALWGISTHQERQPSLFDVLIDDQKVGQWQVWGVGDNGLGVPWVVMWLAVPSCLT